MYADVLCYSASMTDTPPNKERLRLWVAALREEGRVQGVGTLCRIPANSTVKHQCCLHVMIEAAQAAGVSVHQQWRTDTDGDRYASVSVTSGTSSTMWQSNLPPRQVTDWFGAAKLGAIHGNVAINQHPATECGPRYGSKDHDGVCDESIPGIHTIYAASANDALGWTFAMIADEVEKFYRLLED